MGKVKEILIPRENRIKESNAYKVFNYFLIVFMVLMCFVCIYPYYNVVVIAFNDSIDTARGALYYPRAFTVSNFETVLLKDPKTSNAALVSLITVVIGTSVAVFVEYAAAYALSRKQLMGRKSIITFYLIPGFIGGGLIPTYLLYATIGLIDNIWVYILPSVFGFYEMVIMKAYINTIPTSLEEAARIDGANEVYILFRIMLPLSMPIVATVILWQAVGRWNDWSTSLYFINTQKLKNLQFLMWQYIQSNNTVATMVKQGQVDPSKAKDLMSSETVKAAQVVVTTFPILMTYPFLQKYFVKGVLIGSVKE